MKLFFKILCAFSLIFSLFSCSLKTDAIGNSKIYLVGLGLDYYGIANPLSTCDNDIYAFTKQLYALSPSSSNIDSLLFLRTAKDEYVLEGFADSCFTRCGLQVKSAPTTELRRNGEWISGGVRFRIGATDMTDAEKSDDSNSKWGSCLQYFNASTKEKPNNFALAYKSGLSVYIFDPADSSTPKESRIIPDKTSISYKNNIRQSFSFTYEDNKYQDDSIYEIDDSRPNDSAKLTPTYITSQSGFKPSYLYKIDDDDWNHFFIYKCNIMQKTQWGYWGKNESIPKNTIYVPDKIDAWLSSKNIGKDDVFIFYYTGHGAGYSSDDGMKTGIAGELCIRGSESNKYSTIGPEEILNLFEQNEKLKKCNKVYIIDACYSGNFVKIADNSSLVSSDLLATLSINNGSKIYDICDGSDILHSFFQPTSYNSQNKYQKSWVISATSCKNTSFAGTDIYEGSGRRFSAFTSCMLTSLGYDVTRAISTDRMKNKRITLYDIYSSVVESIPDSIKYRTEYEYAQNPQATLLPVDLILF